MYYRFSKHKIISYLFLRIQDIRIYSSLFLTLFNIPQEKYLIMF